MKLISIYLAVSTSRIFATGHQEIHGNSIKLDHPRVAVWYTVGSFVIWSLYFFEKEGVTDTVTADRYVGMLRNFLESKLTEL